MRFLLDHDVDADVRPHLTAAGHDCWTASDAGLFDARDDDLTAYACDRGACLVTHDREFSQRRKANAVGRHIWLVCNEWDASAVLLGALGDILPILERYADVTVTIRAAGAFSVDRAWS